MPGRASFRLSLNLGNQARITFFLYPVSYPLGPEGHVTKATLPSQFSERCKLSAYDYNRGNSLLNDGKKERTLSQGM